MPNPTVQPAQVAKLPRKVQPFANQFGQPNQKGEQIVGVENHFFGRPDIYVATGRVSTTFEAWAGTPDQQDKQYMRLVSAYNHQSPGQVDKLVLEGKGPDGRKGAYQIGADQLRVCSSDSKAGFTYDSKFTDQSGNKYVCRQAHVENYTESMYLKGPTGSFTEALIIDNVDDGTYYASKLPERLAAAQAARETARKDSVAAAAFARLPLPEQLSSLHQRLTVVERQSNRTSGITDAIAGQLAGAAAAAQQAHDNRTSAVVGVVAVGAAVGAVAYGVNQFGKHRAGIH